MSHSKSYPWLKDWESRDILQMRKDLDSRQQEWEVHPSSKPIDG